jgi:hypothetical protein
MPIGSYSSLGRPLLASGGLDHTVKVWDPWSQDAASSKETCLQVRVVQILYYNERTLHDTLHTCMFVNAVLASLDCQKLRRFIVDECCLKLPRSCRSMSRCSELMNCRYAL